MTRIKLPGINKVRKRHADGHVVQYHMIRGKPRSTFWRSDSNVKLGSADYIRAYQEAVRPGSASGDEPGVTTFGKAVIDPYLVSGDFKDKAPRTRRDYQKWIDRIREKWGKAPLAVFEDPRIRQQALKWRDQWTGRQADYAMQVLSLLVSWARDEQRILVHHHLTDSKRRYKANRAEIIWLEDEVLALEKVAPAYIAEPLRASVETGMRPGDLINFTRAWVFPTPTGRRVQARTRKRGKLVAIPITQKLGAIIDRAPFDRELLFVNSRGEQWTEMGLSHAIKKWARKAGVREEVRWYDARGACVTRLVAAGATLAEICGYMGWEPKTAAEMIQVYAKLDPTFSDSVLLKLDDFRNKTANRSANRPEAEEKETG